PPPTTELSTLSLHDALPICHNGGTVRKSGRPARAGISRPLSQGVRSARDPVQRGEQTAAVPRGASDQTRRNRTIPAQCRPFAIADRKSTRLNSSHVKISYAV